MNWLTRLMPSWPDDSTPVDAGRRVLLTGTASTLFVAATAQPAEAACFLGFIGECERDEDGQRPPNSKKESSKRGKSKPPRSANSEAGAFYEKIGRQICAGQWQGHLDQLTIIRAEGRDDLTFTNNLRPPPNHQGPWEFDVKTFRKAAACYYNKRGYQFVANPPEGWETKSMYRLLGELALTAEKATPSKPQSWPSERPYGQEILSVSITRSPDYNDIIGGALRSIHMLGEAADIMRVGKCNDVYVMAGVAYSAGVQGGIAIYDSFVHIDPDAERLDWQVPEETPNRRAVQLQRKQKALSAYEAFKASPDFQRQILTPSPQQIALWKGKQPENLIANNHQKKPSQRLETASIPHPKPAEPVIHVNEQIRGMMETADEIPTNLNALTHPKLGITNGEIIAHIINDPEKAKVLEALADLAGR